LLALLVVCGLGFRRAVPELQGCWKCEAVVDMPVESAAQAAWIEMRAKLATLVDQMTPEDGIEVLRHTVEECEDGDLVIAHMLRYSQGMIDQHIERRQQQGDPYRWFMINGVLLADGKTVWVAYGLHVLADELLVGDAAFAEVAERVRSRYSMTYGDPAAHWTWLTIDEKGASARYEIGTRPFGRQADSG
jgi:hypothetical protein